MAIAPQVFARYKEAAVYQSLSALFIANKEVLDVPANKDDDDLVFLSLMAIAPQVFVRYKEAVLCQFPSALLIVHSEFFYLYDGYRVSDKALVD